MSITRTYKTNKQGSADIDFSNDENGEYTLSISSIASDKYESQEVEKTISIFNGYTTRILINGSENSSFTGAYYDNTRLTLSVQYYDYKTETWKNKSNFEILANFNEQTVTLNETNNVLDLSKLSVKTSAYDVQLQFMGDRTYNESTKTITYAQSQNTPVINVVSELSKYVDEEKSFNVILQTDEGNVLPNQEVVLLKQDNTYTAITNSNGVALFSASVSNDDLMEDVDEETHTLDQTTPYNLTGLSNNEEYVININFNQQLSIATAPLTLTFTENELTITDAEYSKTINFQDKNLKLRITNHNGIYRIFNDLEHLYSKEMTNTSILSFVGDGEITRIQKNTLTNGGIVNQADCTLNVNSTNNLTDAEEELISLYNLELKKQSPISYYVDGYPSNKVINAQSTLTFEHDTLEYGYYIDDSYHSQEDSYMVSDESELEILFVNRSLNYCTKTRLVQRDVELVDWFITDNENYSLNGIGINSLENVVINTDTTITADLGIIGEDVTLLDGSTVLDTQTTNSHGIATFTIQNATTGNKDYVVQYVGNGGFADASSDIFTIHYISSNQTSIALTKNKENIFVDDTVTFTANIGYANKKIKFFVSNTLIDTVTTEDDGSCEFSKALYNSGEYPIRAVFDGDAELQGSSASLLCAVNKYPSYLSVTADKSTCYVGDSVTFSANASVEDNTLFEIRETRDDDSEEQYYRSWFNNYESSIQVNDLQITNNEDTQTITYKCSSENARKYQYEEVIKTVTVSKYPTSISVSRTTYTKDVDDCYVSVKDSNGNNLTEKIIDIYINGNYQGMVFIDSTGKGNIKSTLPVGTNNVTFSFEKALVQVDEYTRTIDIDRKYKKSTKTVKMTVKEDVIGVGM